MATIDIELYYDLDRRRWTTSAGGLATQPSLFIGQSNTIDFKVRFVQGGVPIELTSPSWIAGIKVTDDPLGDYLLLTTTGTKTGTGATTIYTFTLNIDSVELQAYLVGITPTTNSTAFEVRDTVNNIATLPAITCSILPDYTLTGATPAAGSGTLVVDSGATFTVHKTFAMPTDDGQNTYVLKTNGAGVGSWAVDSAGTGTVTNVAVTTANGVSGTVANPTTNAAITLTLGAITPTTGAFSDNTEATDSTTAPLKTAGGMAVAKSLYVGKDLWVTQQGYFDGTVEMTQPLIVSEFQSASGDTKLLLPNTVAGSVNYVAIEPSLTTLPVHIYAQGTDANIGLHLSPKGTGFVNIEDGTDTTKRLRFSASGNSTGITTTLASLSTTSQTITLPNATGATTLAGLQMIQTFSAAQTFSSTVGLTLGTDATNSSTGGTLTVTGGAAVSKKLFVGSLLDLVATTSTAGQITQGGERFIHTYQPSGKNQNVFIGYQAGRTSTMSGGGNVGIGRAVLQSLTSGENNLCFGDGVAYALTSGTANVMIGKNSANSLTSGSNNVACGIGSLGSLVSTNGNTAIGHQALGLQTGGQSVGVGFNSGYKSTGNENVFVGESAGYDTSTIGGLLGVQIESGTNNTMIGQAATSTLISGTYRTAIGSDSRCNADNAIKLGRDTLDRVIFPSWTADPTTDLVVGMVIYRSDTPALKIYTSAGWKTITAT